MSSLTRHLNSGVATAPARIPLPRPAPATRLIAVPALGRARRQAQLEQLASDVLEGGAPGPFAVSVLIAALADDSLGSSARACAWHDYVTARRRLDATLEASLGWDGIMTAAEASAAASAAATRLLDGIQAPPAKGPGGGS
jgi:hypothetical protein